MQHVFLLDSCPYFLLFVVILSFTAFAQNGPQPCPENAIVLTGSDYPQFVYSPYDEWRQYPPNTDCRFVLIARSMQHRIHLSVIESKLEEPLFTECEDYVSIRDGGLPTSDEVLRWCGSYFPPSLTSSGDSLYIHFHSDNIVQSRGFNLSFVDYLIPGCPADWIRSDDSMYCYKMFSSAHGYTFLDAQRNCFYERSNLLTIENAREYQFIVGKYSDSHKFPWIGYNDANKEGEFDAIDPNVPIWPEDLSSSLRGDHKDKDCVFLDWNSIKEGPAHTVDDCRNRHAFICKKRQDGTTVPIQLSATLLRHGFEDPVFNYTLILLILLVLLVLLIILWIIYQKCKKRNVVAASEGSRLVQSAPHPDTAARAATAAATITLAPVPEEKRKKERAKTAATDAVKNVLAISASRTTEARDLALQKTDDDQTFQLDDSLFVKSKPDVNSVTPTEYQPISAESPRIRTSPNQRAPQAIDSEFARAQRRDSNPVLSDESEAELGLGETPVPFSPVKGDNASPAMHSPPDRSHLYESGPVTVTTKDETKDAKDSGVASKTLSSTLPPVGEPSGPSREATIQTGITGPSSHRSRGTQPSHGFDRPHVGTLENVSAISLDEFWQESK